MSSLDTKLKPKNGTVFIKRYDTEQTSHGLEISERALTKNMLGVVSAVESDKFVTIGDIVHLPHYSVDDSIVCEEEYAITKLEKLFAKKVGDQWKPINKFVKIRKCVNDHIRDESGEIALHLLESDIEKTNWCEIVEVADDCEYITARFLEYFCHVEEDEPTIQRLEGSKDFMIHESSIKWVTTGE